MNWLQHPSNWTNVQVGILAGCMVFVTVVIITFALLYYGGSFKRMQEQSQQYSKGGANALKVSRADERPRLYEALSELRKTLPIKPQANHDTVLKGITIELRVLDNAKDRKEILKTLYEISNGEAACGHNSYNEREKIWDFMPDGPFENVKKFIESEIFAPKPNGLTFYVTDLETGYLIGTASILNNEPRNLRCEIGNIWLTPFFQGKCSNMELHFFLLDYLFNIKDENIGYRRVEWKCDAENFRARRAAQSIGFKFEAILEKFMIINDSNQNTAIFSMTNSDWRDGGKKALQDKLEKKVPKKILLKYKESKVKKE